MKIKLKNLGTQNKNVVEIEYIKLYFSYETIIAYSTPNYAYVTNKNFSQTTSKMQNELKAEGFKEISEELFYEGLKNIFNAIQINMEMD